MCPVYETQVFELNERVFFDYAVALLVLVVVPAAILYTICRFLISNRVGPRAGITVLGLDESSSTYSALGESRLTRYLELPYILTGILTFVLGLLASAVFRTWLTQAFEV